MLFTGWAFSLVLRVVRVVCEAGRPVFFFLSAILFATFDLSGPGISSDTVPAHPYLMHLYYVLLGFAVGGVNPTSVTKFSKFETLWIVLFILRGGVVAAFAGCASQRHHDAIFFALACHVSLRSGSGLIRHIIITMYCLKLIQLRHIITYILQNIYRRINLLGPSYVLLG